MSEIEERAEQYERALAQSNAMQPVMKPCHDCGVNPGELHKEGCDSASCTICGVQLLQCNHYPVGNSVHTGIESQELRILCEVMNLFSKFTKNGWEGTTRDDPEGHYGLNEATVLYQCAIRRLNKRMQEGRY